MSETQPSRLPTSLLISLAAVAALGLGIWLASQLFAPQRLESENLHGTYLEGGRDVTEFSLVDHNGEPFGRDRLEGAWTVMFFGFTNCPDICPMTMLELGQAMSLVRDEGTDKPIRGVFVTVDPARDTPERLASYVTAFDHDFLGLTGSLDDIDVLARDLGIVHVRHDEDDDEDYMVDHGSAVLLINPEGRLQALFQAPHRAQPIAEDLSRILSHHGDI